MDQKLKDNLIVGIETFPLKIIRDERGAVMHMIRSSDPYFEKFGELYFSLINPGQVKGWKKHKEIYQYMVVPEGMVQIVFYDDRDNSQTKGLLKCVEFGVANYLLLKVPPNVWYSFKAVSKTHALIANCTTAPHDPKESETLPLETSSIPFRWH
ncbi:MAG: dTDP-4-dehydrorhamnose 3,5-epimerase family protein [Bacteriovorax sp.]|nr:dTDP-4-dehydrorhamnose 3,5-epimerase family protein [Bacteriovorax sp.]